MNITRLLVFTAMLGFQYSNAQTGIGNNHPDKSAILDLTNSVNKGLLIPKIALTSTTVAAPVTAPATSLMVYNTATAGDVTPGYYHWDGVKWVRIVNDANLKTTAWLPNGNNNGAIKTIGTNDNFDLPIVTNNTEKVRVTSDGRMGIGTTTPSGAFEVTNDNKGDQFDDVAITSFGTGTTSPSFYMRKLGGTALAPTNTKNGNIIGNLAWSSRVAGNFLDTSIIRSTYKGDGTTNLGTLEFSTSGSEKMRIDENGKVGIGTTAPSSSFDIVNDNKADVFDDIHIYSYGGTTTPSFFMRKSGGTAATPTDIANGSLIGSVVFVPRAGGAFMANGGAYMRSTYKGNGTTNLETLEFATSGAEKMRIDENGNLGIGTTSPTTRLEVNNGTTAGAIKIVDGTQGVNRVLTSDANGVGKWKEAAVTTSKFKYIPTYPNNFALGSFASVNNVGSPFDIQTTGIYRVLVDMNLPSGYILGVDNAALSNTVFYSNSKTRMYNQYFIYLTAGTHQLIIFGDNPTADNTVGPYFHIEIEGPIN